MSLCKTSDPGGQVIFYQRAKIWTILVEVDDDDDDDGRRTASDHISSSCTSCIGELNKDTHNQNNYGVGVQLPKEWRYSRKELYPIMHSEKSKVNKVKFISDKLYCNGHVYKPRQNPNTNLYL